MTTTMNRVTVLDRAELTQQLSTVGREAGIDESTAATLRSQFSEYYRDIESLRAMAAAITEPDNLVQQKEARVIRCKLKSVRCDVEHTRKRMKAESLSRGKAIDGFANILKYLCEPAEKQLLDIELYAQRQEEKRIADIVADRTERIQEEGGDPGAFNLGAMNEDTFNAVLHGIIQQRVNAEAEAAQAEQERIAKEKAEEAERERIRKENDRLKAEATEREAEAAKERKAAAEAKRVQDAKIAKERKAAETRLKVERDARAKAQAEAQTVKDAEANRVAAEQAAIKAAQKAEAKAAQAPDKEKLITFRTMLSELRLSMTTEAGNNAKARIYESWKKLIKCIDEEISHL